MRKCFKLIITFHFYGANMIIGSIWGFVLLKASHHCPSPFPVKIPDLGVLEFGGAAKQRNTRTSGMQTFFWFPRDDLHSFVSNVPVLLSHVIPSCWIVLPHAQEAKTFCRMKSMIALYAKMLGLAVSRRWKPLPSPEGKSSPQLKLGNYVIHEKQQTCLAIAANGSRFLLSVATSSKGISQDFNWNQFTFNWFSFWIQRIVRISMDYPFKLKG